MVISALGFDKTLNMHCPGHITVQGSQLASKGRISRQNESRLKNNVPCSEGQFVGGAQMEICLKNQHFFASKLGNGPLLEHGPLIEILR